MERDILTPPRNLADAVARWNRRDRTVGKLVTAYDALVPFLFAVFIAAPVGLLILVFFVPKFVRNAQRRRRYGVRLSSEPVERIAGSSGEMGGTE